MEQTQVDNALAAGRVGRRSRLSCDWIGCDAPSHRIQADHEVEWNEPPEQACGPQELETGRRSDSNER